jgi:hypothetical protein
MKRVTTIVVLLLAVITIYGQDIVGTWNGSITAETPDGEVTVRLVFHITATDDGFSSTMDSPDQDTLGIKTDATTFENKELIIKLAQGDFVYTGKLVDAKNIKGSFTQMGATREMDMTKKEE